MKTLTKLTLIASAAAMLASCGLRGDLKRPAEPMFGGAKSATSSTEATTETVEGDAVILKQEEEQDDYSDELLGGPDD